MIRLIKRFKYDNNYDYVKLFTSKEEQEQYFRTLDYINIDETNYIKVNNTFNVNYDFEYLEEQGVNYVIFNNGYRNVYAFIILKEYLRKDVTRLTVEVDVFQTYMFNFSLANSYVERKKCNVNEVVNFDEGLNIGEHIIAEDNTVFNKDSVYFAMFNGFKEQELIFDGTILKSVVDLPYQTSKPLTVIDGIQYPLYFMPLKETYNQGTYTKLNTPGSGETVGGTISAKILRFIKGYEGYSPYAYNHNGESKRTGGYGIREDYQSKYFALLEPFPCSEQKASEVLAQCMQYAFANDLYQQMLRDGLTGKQIKQHHFDAFLSLAYNTGLYGATSSDMYQKYILNQNDTTIYNDWLTYYIKDENDNILEGLKTRRKEEATIFRDNIYNYKPISEYSSMGTIIGTVTDNNGNGYIPNTVLGGV